MSSGAEEEAAAAAQRRGREARRYPRDFLLSRSFACGGGGVLPAGFDASALAVMGLFLDQTSRQYIHVPVDARPDGQPGDLPPLGVPESLQTSDGSKWKPCTRFVSTGGCSFGEDCRFLHCSPDSIQQAAAPAMNSLGKKVVSAIYGGSATAKISVVASFAGAIIGKGGASIKQISRATGAKLAIRDHEADAGLKNVELQGTFDEIKDASGRVEELIASFLSHGSRLSAVPCQFFTRGSCTNGDRCRYAHGEGGELHGAPGEIKVDAGAEVMEPVDNGSSPGSKFKTKLCGHLARGICTHGDRCSFAHGEGELRKYVPLEAGDAAKNFWAHDESPAKKGGW